VERVNTRQKLCIQSIETQRLEILTHFSVRWPTTCWSWLASVHMFHCRRSGSKAPNSLNLKLLDRMLGRPNIFKILTHAAKWILTIQTTGVIVSFTGTGEIRTSLVHQYTRVLETGKCCNCQKISGRLHYFQYL